MNKLVCQKRAARSAALSERSVYDVLLSVVRAVALGLFVLGVFVCRANVHGVFGIMRSRLILSTAGILLCTLFVIRHVCVLRRAVFVATLACYRCALRKNACAQSNTIVFVWQPAWHGAREQERPSLEVNLKDRLEQLQREVIESTARVQDLERRPSSLGLDHACVCITNGKPPRMRGQR